MPTTDSPLRYPGGKTQLAPFVADLLRANDLASAVYAEPFAGGAGIAWRLLFTSQVCEVWLNDLDPNVFAFWRCVLDRSDELCELIERTPVTIEEWHRQRRALMDGRTGVLRRGFATLYLNRTNRSGILLGGVIGGKDQTGDYKIDCRFNREELIRKVQRISAYRDAVKLTNADAAECIVTWSKALPKRSIINIDPPYFVRGQELYANAYRPDDHKQLAKLIRGLDSPWMLTYDDAPEIERLYAGLQIFRKSLVYYAQVKRRAEELLILSKRLVPPPELVDRRAAA